MPQNQMKKPLVSIVISTYNRTSSLNKYCFPGLTQLTYPNYEIIVVNDGSTDETQTFLDSCVDEMNNLLVIHNKKNQGLCFSRNVGVANAKGEIIVFSDDDVRLHPDCLDELVKVYENDLDVMAIWGCVYEYGGSWKEGKKTFGSGSLMSFRRLVFNNFRFDTNLRYFKTYSCDEHEFMRRIQRHGFKIIKVETAKADHFHAFSKDRSWRWVGGDLNFLYENLKSGSVSEYYLCLLMGIILTFKELLTKEKPAEKWYKHMYKEMFQTPKRLFAMLKERQFSIAIKWLFYTLVDIPLRAKTKGIIESIARTHSKTWPV